MTLATKALDEAGQRISRYLLMQSLINGSFRVVVGLGLFLIGVPYAILWGFLGAALRFIPYVGPAVSALLPIALSLAVFPGWVQPFMVVGLIGLLELSSNMAMEPLLYGQSAGVSAVALLVAMTLRETRGHVMELIPLFSTLEPQPTPNVAYGLSLPEESPVRPASAAGVGAA
jgi:predicted PurR-regulated permease PerM